MKFSLKKPKNSEVTQTSEAQDASQSKPKADNPLSGLFAKTSKSKAGKLSKAKSKKNLSANKKEAFNFKKFMAEVNSLNAQNYGSAPIAVKVFVLTMLFILILVLAWFLLISKKLDEIKAAESQQTALLEQYKQQESKARHL